MNSWVYQVIKILLLISVVSMLGYATLYGDSHYERQRQQQQ